MSDDPKKHSNPTEEKAEPKKVSEENENPKEHGSEAGGEAGEGRTGTKRGSTDS